MSDPLMEDLRARFRQTTAVRLHDMKSLLDAVDASAADRLLRHFHALAGMGATYGFPRVSELGDEGEGLFVVGVVPDERAVERMRELVAEVERQLC
jgi:Hpt domain